MLRNGLAYCSVSFWVRTSVVSISPLSCVFVFLCLIGCVWLCVRVLPPCGPSFLQEIRSFFLDAWAVPLSSARPLHRRHHQQMSSKTTNGTPTPHPPPPGGFQGAAALPHDGGRRHHRGQEGGTQALRHRQAQEPGRYCHLFFGGGSLYQAEGGIFGRGGREGWRAQRVAAGLGGVSEKR